MNNYRLVYETERGLAIECISETWLKKNNNNFALFAEKCDIKDYKIVNVNDLPNDRVLRNALTMVTDLKTRKVKVTKCPERAKQIIRNIRNKKLDKLDILKLNKSLDINELEIQAQELRDITKRFTNNINDLEDIYRDLNK